MAREQTTMNDLWGNQASADIWGDCDFGDNKTCVVCLESVDKKDFVEHQLCKHSQCKDCFTRYLKMCVKEITRYPIKCYEAGCKKKWNIAFLQNFLTEEEKKKFNRFHDKVVNGMEYLSCPGDCKDVETRVDPRKGQIFNCHKCKIRICIKCHRSHDLSQTCEDVMTMEQRINEQRMNEVAKKENLVTCPRCKFDIQRVAACREMWHECAGYVEGIHFCCYCATLLKPGHVRFELNNPEKMHFPQGTNNPCINATEEQIARELR